MKPKAIAASILSLSLMQVIGMAHAQWIDIKDPNELRDLYSDRKITTTTEDGKPWNEIMSKVDGHGFASGRAFEWTRNWVVKGEQVCVNEHLQGFERIWLCVTVQRNAVDRGEYRTTAVGPRSDVPIAIPRILYLKVHPIPDYRKGDSEAAG